MPLPPALRRAVRRVAVRLPQRRDGLDLRRLRQLLGREVRTVLEIGANDGGDTLRLHATFPQARLCAFEPEPRALTLLRTATRGTSIEVYATAVGAHDGTTVFHQSGGQPPRRSTARTLGVRPARERDWHLSGSIRPPTGHLTTFPWVTFDSTITVDVTRLDTWADTHGVDEVDFIWADVQGAEIDLIAGGVRTLADTRFLYTEVYDTPLYEGQIGLDEILRRLPGWSVEQRFPHDVLLRNTTWEPPRTTAATV